MIEERFGLGAEITPGKTGQFDVFADGAPIASRGGNPLTRVLFGAGFPDLEAVVARIESLRRG